MYRLLLVTFMTLLMLYKSVKDVLIHNVFPHFWYFISNELCCFINYFQNSLIHAFRNLSPLYLSYGLLYIICIFFVFVGQEASPCLCRFDWRIDSWTYQSRGMSVKLEVINEKNHLYHEIISLPLSLIWYLVSTDILYYF